jgi:hypothetical protein
MAAQVSDDDDGAEAPSETPNPNHPLTIDDVPRLGSGTGIAIGCGLVVAIAIGLFWFVRGWLLHH